MSFIRSMLLFILLTGIGGAQSPREHRYVVLSANSQAEVSPNLEWDSGSYGSWVLTEASVLSLEADLPHISTLKIKGWESSALRIERPDKYYRQYVGVTHGGKRRIYINAFCVDPPPSDWRKRFYVVRDGATCFWQAFYDPSTGTFSDLTINPRA